MIKVLPSGGSRGAQEPPFRLHRLALRSTDDKLKGTALSGYKTKNTAAVAHLRRKYVRKVIDWTGRAGSLEND